MLASQSIVDFFPDIDGDIQPQLLQRQSLSLL